MEVTCRVVLDLHDFLRVIFIKGIKLKTTDTLYTWQLYIVAIGKMLKMYRIIINILF